MTTVRMLCSAEGEYSLSAGKVYELPAELADSFLKAGFAETPEKGHEAAETPAPNVPAPHHTEGYQEFTSSEEPPAEGKPAKRTSSGKSKSRSRKSS